SSSYCASRRRPPGQILQPSHLYSGSASIISQLHINYVVMSLPYDQLLEAFQAIGLLRRLVPADAVDAREAQGDAGLVAGRALYGIESDLEDQARAHRAHRPEALCRVGPDPAVELLELLVREAEIGLA